MHVLWHLLVRRFVRPVILHHWTYLYDLVQGLGVSHQSRTRVDHFGPPLQKKSCELALPFSTDYRHQPRLI